MVSISSRPTSAGAAVGPSCEAAASSTLESPLSYVNLVAPRVNGNDPTAVPKYSVTILIPKSDTALKQNIDASIEAAAADAQANPAG